MKRRLIFVDTDAGTDDAIALIMLLKHPNIEVVGISCVGGNTGVHQVAQNVMYILEKLNKDIPVYVGADRPLTRPLKSSGFIHGSDGFGDLDIDNQGRTPASIDAIEGLKKAIEVYHQSLTVITIGPMTNLALMLQRYPDLTQRIGQLWIMGGNYQMPGNITPVSEYNFWADPEASNYCLQASIPKTLVGWDITIRSGYLTLDELEQLKSLEHELLQALYDMQHIRFKWLEEYGQDIKCTLADACAVTALLRDDFITASGEYYCDIVLSDDDDDTRGMLIVDINNLKGQQPNAHVILQADREVFVEEVLKLLLL